MLTIKKRSFFKIIILSLCAIFILIGCTNPADRLLSQGDKYINEGKYDSAIKVLTELTAISPQNPVAWNALGIAYHYSGNYIAAAHSYATALKFSNNFAVVHYNLGCALFAMQNYIQASREFASYVMYYPQSIDGWLKLGVSQLFSRLYDAAEKSFKQVLSLNPQSCEAYNGLAVASYFKNRHRDALQYLNSALKLNPNYPPANLNMAVVLLQGQKDLNGSIEMFKRYQMLKPNTDFSRAISNLLQKIESLKQPPLTEQTIGTHTITTPAAIQEKKITPISNVPAAPQLTTNHQPITNRVEPTTIKQPVPTNISTQEKTSTEPTNIIKITSTKPESLTPPPEKPKQVTRDVQKPQLTSSISAVSAKVNLTEEKTGIESQVEKTKPTAVVMPAEDAKTSSIQEHPTKRAGESLAPEPAISKAAEEKKPSLFQRLNPFARKSSPSRVTPLPGTSPETIVSAKTQENASSDKPAQKEDKKVSQIAKSEETGSVQPATVITQKVTISFPLYNYIRPSAPTQGDRPTAEKYLSLGISAHSANNLSEAKKYYELAIKSDPSLFAAHYNLGLLYYELKDYNNALSCYETALAINPKAPNAKFNFALTLRQANYCIDAAKELEEYLLDNPKDNKARLILANLYAQQLQQPQKAIKHYTDLLTLEPTHPQASAIYAWIKANSK